MTTGGDYRYPFSPFPDGWYCLAFSDEIAPGELRGETFMGREIVLFRTGSGTIAVTDAHCPHMGGHLARGGEVRGETVRCPFHGFCFDTRGRCTRTGYDTKPPPRARLRTWPVREQGGLILVHYDAGGREPRWDVPELDQRGWAPIVHERFRVRSHPQETTENSVDFGHFAVVHGYTDTRILSELRVEGPHLSGRYSMKRVADLFLQSSRRFETFFDVHVWGLGYSLVEAHVPEMGLHFRVYVLPSPIDGEYIHIRSGANIRGDVDPSRVHWGLGMLPRPLALRVLNWTILKGYCHDLKADFDVWTHKTYVDPPVLARGDGPIAEYRRYCRQFYPESRRRIEAVQSGRPGAIVSVPGSSA